MKKPFKLILIGVLLLLAVGTFKNRTNNDLTAPADISEELAQLPADNNFEEKTVDFSLCDTDKSVSFSVGSGTNKLKMLGPDEDSCLVQTTFQTPAGHYTNDCQIPLSLGQITFKDADFSTISQYCQIKTTGGGLLELE